MTPINKILQVKPQIVRWEDFLAVKQAFKYWRTLLKEAAHEPTTAKEMVMGDTNFWDGKMHPERVLEAVGYQVKMHWNQQFSGWKWPKKLQARLVTPTNPGGGLYIDILEMVRKLLT